jgi:hypothetical protein
MAPEPTTNSRIKVRATHWSRAHQYGLIIDPQSHQLPEIGERFLVYFDKPGVGIEARMLYLDEKDFSVLNVPTV